MESCPWWCNSTTWCGLIKNRWNTFVDVWLLAFWTCHKTHSLVWDSSGRRWTSFSGRFDPYICGCVWVCLYLHKEVLLWEDAQVGSRLMELDMRMLCFVMRDQMLYLIIIYVPKPSDFWLCSYAAAFFFEITVWNDSSKTGFPKSSLLYIPAVMQPHINGSTSFFLGFVMHGVLFWKGTSLHL